MASSGENGVTGSALLFLTSWLAAASGGPKVGEDRGAATAKGAREYGMAVRVEGRR